MKIIDGYRSRIYFSRHKLVFNFKNKLGNYKSFLDKAEVFISAQDPKTKIPALKYKLDNIERNLTRVLKLKTVDYTSRINSAQKNLIYYSKNRVGFFASYIDKYFSVISANNPRNKIHAFSYKVESLGDKLHKKVISNIGCYLARVNACESNLKVLDPVNVLDRGYALVYKKGIPVTGITNIKEKDFIEIKLKDGYINSFVDSIIPEGIDGQNSNNS